MASCHVISQVGLSARVLASRPFIVLVLLTGVGARWGGNAVRWQAGGKAVRKKGKPGAANMGHSRTSPLAANCIASVRACVLWGKQGAHHLHEAARSAAVKICCHLCSRRYAHFGACRLEVLVAASPRPSDGQFGQTGPSSCSVTCCPIVHRVVASPQHRGDILSSAPSTGFLDNDLFSLSVAGRLFRPNYWNIE
jgi:hypothetical protein